MTVDQLIAEASRNRTGPVALDCLEPDSVREFLALALDYLLEDFDYEQERGSGQAIAARIMATMITGADELMAKRRLS